MIFVQWQRSEEVFQLSRLLPLFIDLDMFGALSLPLLSQTPYNARRNVMTSALCDCHTRTGPPGSGGIISAVRFRPGAGFPPKYIPAGRLSSGIVLWWMTAATTDLHPLALHPPRSFPPSTVPSARPSAVPLPSLSRPSSRPFRHGGVSPRPAPAAMASVMTSVVTSRYHYKPDCGLMHRLLWDAIIITISAAL